MELNQNKDIQIQSLHEFEMSKESWKAWTHSILTLKGLSNTHIAYKDSNGKSWIRKKTK